jgi:type IV secretion system protein VirD4
MPESIKNAANNFRGKSKDTGQPRVIDSLNQHMRIWDNDGLREATKQTDFSFKDLKDTPATVYLILPFEEIQAYSTYVRMVLAMALNAMLENHNKPDIPILFVLDEFLALDPDDRFVSALRTHASAGVRLWFFLQDIPTLEQKYPKNWKSFFQVETQCFFGTGDIHTAKLISESIGNTTVAYESPNTSASTSGGTGASASYSISENVTLTSRNLMTPDEVVTYMVGSSDKRNGILFLKDIGRASQIELTPYYNSSTFKERL